VSDHPLFYVVLLGLIVIVFAQIAFKREKQPAPKQQTMALEEFEQTVEMFASDLEEQNEALAQLFADTKRDYELHLAKQTGKIESLEKLAQEMASEMTQMKRAMAEGSSAAHAQSMQLGAAPETAATGVAAGSPEVGSESVPEALDAESQPEQVDAEASASDVLPTLQQRYPDIFSLYQAGKSIEYIAKKLDKNKGEVSLILMLSKQEEGAR